MSRHRNYKTEAELEFEKRIEWKKYITDRLDRLEKRVKELEDIHFIVKGRRKDNIFHRQRKEAVD